MIKDFDSWVAAARSAGWQVSGREHRIFRDPDHAIDPEMKVSSFALYCFVKQYFHDLPAQDFGAFSFPFFVAPEPLPLSYVLRDGWKIDDTDLRISSAAWRAAHFQGRRGPGAGVCRTRFWTFSRPVQSWISTKRSSSGYRGTASTGASWCRETPARWSSTEGHVEDFPEASLGAVAGNWEKKTPGGLNDTLRLEAPTGASYAS